MKTQEELTHLKNEYESLTSKLQELTEDELNMVAGGDRFLFVTVGGDEVDRSIYLKGMAVGPNIYGMTDAVDKDRMALKAQSDDARSPSTCSGMKCLIRNNKQM